MKFIININGICYNDINDICKLFSADDIYDLFSKRCNGNSCPLESFPLFFCPFNGKFCDDITSEDWKNVFKIENDEFFIPFSISN